MFFPKLGSMFAGLLRAAHRPGAYPTIPHLPEAPIVAAPSRKRPARAERIRRAERFEGARDMNPARASTLAKAMKRRRIENGTEGARDPNDVRMAGA